MINRDLVNRTLAYIETYPERWKQDWWATKRDIGKKDLCDTTFCFAGTALFLSGARFKFNGEESYLVYTDSLPEAVRLEGAVTQHISQAAEALLGFSEWQASDLFYGQNRLTDIRNLISQYFNDETEEEQ
jgi:hypothetical protein